MKVEFYLGDANLPTDTFLWNETGGATNNPVAIKKIHAFNRMKRFPDFDVVVAALKESKFLDVVEHNGEECVKRKVPYDPDTPRSKADGRSVYVKGFGDEEPSSQFDIENFFLTYGATRQVRLRRTEEKLFKGSVFVEWEDEETQQKFLALDPKPEWRGNPLKIMPKKAYMAEKEDEIKDGKMEPKESWGPESRGGWGRGYQNGRGGRDGHRDIATTTVTGETATEGIGTQTIGRKDVRRTKQVGSKTIVATETIETTETRKVVVVIVMIVTPMAEIVIVRTRMGMFSPNLSYFY
jgi:lupus La protein